ncbi:cell death-inducing p53-target protein 1 homolog [Oryzias melastigma]|uniref:cell death-inducing p53-target protein 1 homolog n=1 Tax=Oryzias melastigma TaxID=30732 RepID=UPI00168D64EA|nr:cell death-inducing p53-target protein 1 homolog [Oryzias melastigma]
MSQSMEPPSYEEISQQPPALRIEVSNPPAYTSSLPSTPPPAYGDAVQSNPFPLLTRPSVPVVVISSEQPPGVIVHQVTQYGGRRSEVAVVSQPAPVPIIASCLRESPALVVCPHCQELVTTKIKHVAGKNAWGICMTLSLLGLFCGFCLIPLAIPRCQDVVHLCPSCKKQIYVFER